MKTQMMGKSPAAKVSGTASGDFLVWNNARFFLPTKKSTVAAERFCNFMR